MGSIGNALVYIINEGVVSRPNSNILNNLKNQNNEENDRKNQNNEEDNYNISLKRISTSLKTLQDQINNI